MFYVSCFLIRWIPLILLFVSYAFILNIKIYFIFPVFVYNRFYDEKGNKLDIPKREIAFIWIAPNQLHLQSYNALKSYFAELRSIKPIQLKKNCLKKRPITSFNNRKNDIYGWAPKMTLTPMKGINNINKINYDENEDFKKPIKIEGELMKFYEK